MTHERYKIGRVEIPHVERSHELIKKHRWKNGQTSLSRNANTSPKIEINKNSSAILHGQISEEGLKVAHVYVHVYVVSVLLVSQIEKNSFLQWEVC